MSVVDFSVLKIRRFSIWTTKTADIYVLLIEVTNVISSVEEGCLFRNFSEMIDQISQEINEPGAEQMNQRCDFRLCFCFIIFSVIIFIKFCLTCVFRFFMAPSKIV